MFFGYWREIRISIINRSQSNKNTTNKRLQDILRYLQENYKKKTPLQDIAYETDFTSQSYYDQRFRNIKGISPLKYRRIIENKSDLYRQS